MLRILLIFLVLSVHISTAVAQNSQPVFVIVHGAWGGSWAFKKVDSLLTQKGCLVYRPSLTGLGERVHLAGQMEIGLHTHINDVVNTILFEDLHQVVLVGHSYGGMVVTGVADSIADRIKTVIYLDAFVPGHGESLKMLVGPQGAGLTNMAKNGFVTPFWVKKDATIPKDVPHPVKTLTDSVFLKGRAQNIPVTYIHTVAANTDATKDDFASQAERARKRGWPVIVLAADHNPQITNPPALVEMLYKYR
jgi:pimeloyl-ACP methyl ester carboxylesterase